MHKFFTYLIIILLLYPSSAQSLSCAHSIKSEMRDFDIVFKGKVVDTKSSSSSDKKIAVFEVEEVLKGKFVKKLSAEYKGGEWGFDPEHSKEGWFSFNKMEGKDLYTIPEWCDLSFHPNYSYQPIKFKACYKSPSEFAKAIEEKNIKNDKSFDDLLCIATECRNAEIVEYLLKSLPYLKHKKCKFYPEYPGNKREWEPNYASAWDDIHTSVMIKLAYDYPVDNPISYGDIQQEYITKRAEKIREEYNQILGLFKSHELKIEKDLVGRIIQEPLIKDVYITPLELAKELGKNKLVKELEKY